MFCLAKELAALGHHLITTTTTKIREPGGADTPFLSLGESHEAILDKVHRFGHITVASHRVAGGKLQGISPRQADALWESGEMDYLIIEADGAAQRPLKAPESCEPVIPSCTGVVVGLVGADGFGARLTEEVVFRSAIFSRLTGIPFDAVITNEAISLAFTHTDGLLRGAPLSGRIVFFVNKVDLDDGLQKGTEFARVILDSGDSRIERVVLGHLQSDRPVVEVIFRN
jgi:probable selenium-dependent hydroxylase accessory protein YqeC